MARRTIKGSQGAWEVGGGATLRIVGESESAASSAASSSDNPAGATLKIMAESDASSGASLPAELSRVEYRG